MDSISQICVLCCESIYPYNHIYCNNDFMCVIKENHTESDKFSLMNSNEKVFNPFELNNNDIDDIFPTPDIDPDKHFYNQTSTVCHSNYYLEDSFVKHCIMNSLDSNCFSLFHLNIRSAPKNLEHLDAYLKCINFNFTILGLSETWFNDYTVANYDTNGYVKENVYRKDKRGGGVSLFIKDKISYILRNDLNCTNEFIESLFVQIPRNI